MKRLCGQFDTGNPGNLYGIRVKDGAVIFKQSLQGTGRQLSTPLIYRNTLYLVSTFADTGKSIHRSIPDTNY